MVNKATRGFEYVERNVAQYERRANQSAKDREGFIKDGIPVYTPPAKLNQVRVLPPTWEDPEHYGLDVWVHYSIGPDNSAFVCRKRMARETCPVCEEIKAAEARGDMDYASSLKEKKRVLVWIIDRADEKAGPMLWPMPWTIDRELVQLAVEKDPTSPNSIGDILHIDHPDKGYDFQFKREGTGIGTKYESLKILERRSTPISNNGEQAMEWLGYVMDHPIPSCILIADEAHVREILNGKAVIKEEDKFQEEFGREEEKELTYEVLTSMTTKELTETALEAGIKKTDLRGAEDEEIVCMICDALHIDIPEEEDIPVEVVKEESISDRLAKLRSNRK